MTDNCFDPLERKLTDALYGKRSVASVLRALNLTRDQALALASGEGEVWPKEPTKEMVRAGLTALDACRDVYVDMRAARPWQSQDKGEG